MLYDNLLLWILLAYCCFAVAFCWRVTSGQSRPRVLREFTSFFVLFLVAFAALIGGSALIDKGVWAYSPPVFYWGTTAVHSVLALLLLKAVFFDGGVLVLALPLLRVRLGRRWSPQLANRALGLWENSPAKGLAKLQSVHDGLRAL